VIVYLDASALVKRYVAEAGSTDVGTLVEVATLVGTAIVSRPEVAAALGKAARMKLISHASATAALRAFTSEWESFVRLQMTEVLMARAAELAWEQGLRGYDATHLAAAHFWQQVMGDLVTLATYDWQLWDAAKATGLVPWPADRGS
jgi:predicted nucleic acid-binding protein